MKTIPVARLLVAILLAASVALPLRIPGSGPVLPAWAGPPVQAEIQASMLSLRRAACDGFEAEVRSLTGPVLIEVSLNKFEIRSDIVGPGIYAVRAWPLVALLKEGLNEYRVTLHAEADVRSPVTGELEGHFRCGDGYPQPAGAAPASPEQLVAEVREGGEVVLSWVDRSDNEEHFGVYFDGEVRQWMPADSRQATVVGLTSDRYTCFAVFANNKSGDSSFSNWACVTTRGLDETVPTSESPTPTGVASVTSTPSPSPTASASPSAMSTVSPVPSTATPAFPDADESPEPVSPTPMSPDPLFGVTPIPPAVRPLPCSLGLFWNKGAFTRAQADLGALRTALTEAQDVLAGTIDQRGRDTAASHTGTLPQVGILLNLLSVQLDEIQALLVEDPCAGDEMALRVARADKTLNDALRLLGENQASSDDLSALLGELRALLAAFGSRLHEAQVDVFWSFVTSLAGELLVVLVLWAAKKIWRGR